ncbi:MAG: TetR/AcrR family transcriptional regulator [Bacilli bacterium]|nr:TetR/AcrR family transcriptional regulator [Bacilli bacterium]
MDKRIINSKNKLNNTLLSLLEEKRIKDVTVLELCSKANINRTTFYKYYKDIDDLVNQMEEILINELEQNIAEIKRNYLLTYTNKILTAINDKKEIYTKLLSKNGDHTFLRRILSSVYNQSLEEWQKLLKKASKEDLENIYNFIVDGTIGIIENWINNKCTEDPNNIAIFINKICMSGLSSFI